jgi:hypothetical protein
MVGVLGDGVVFRRAGVKGGADDGADSGADSDVSIGSGVDAEYEEEMSLEHFNHRHSGSPRAFWQMGYQKQRQASAQIQLGVALPTCFGNRFGFGMGVLYFILVEPRVGLTVCLQRLDRDVTPLRHSLTRRSRAMAC